MDPMTETKNELSVADFYDDLAPDYDAMTGFEKRFIMEKPFFRLLVERHKIKTALDAGCGTGFHSLLLSQLGVEVTAVDVSKEMLRRLEKHANELGLNVKTVESNFQNLGKVIKSKVDAVFSLGNSIPHLLTDEELRSTFANFADLLNPQGILFIQNLNYDRILAAHERVQNVKESAGKTFTRSYDYNEKNIAFNIVTAEKTDNSITERRKTVLLRPLLSHELISFLKEAGFNDVRSFGGISMEEFRKGTSKDLFVVARRKL